MTLAIIISRYNDPDINNRRRNVREAMALCRWAVAQSYAPVCSLLHLADVNDPPEDTAGEVRERVMAYSRELARMVGAARGACFVAGWYTQTTGMGADVDAYYHGAECRGGGSIRRVTLAEIEPYLPRDLVGQVQAAVDEIMTFAAGHGISYERDDIEECAHMIDRHTGVTPTEVDRG